MTFTLNHLHINAKTKNGSKTKIKSYQEKDLKKIKKHTDIIYKISADILDIRIFLVPEISISSKIPY